MGKKKRPTYTSEFKGEAVKLALNRSTWVTPTPVGDYHAAHPDIEDRLEREVAWGREFEGVHKAEFPQSWEALKR
ncbi:hypothetical protein KKF91_08945 [Myxococcota bacterium]|nr:hypothetical protein [Myxococcota bacterium]